MQSPNLCGELLGNSQTGAINRIFRYLPGSVGSPQAEVALCVMNQDDQVAPVGEWDELAVKGANVFTLRETAKELI